MARSDPKRRASAGRARDPIELLAGAVLAIVNALLFAMLGVKP